MNLGSAWRTLGIKRTADTGAIRRAYAQQLKALDVDREIEAYAALRDARDTALFWARAQASAPTVDPLAETADDPPDSPAAESPPAAGWTYAAPLIEGIAQSGGPHVPIPAELKPGYRPLTPQPALSGTLQDMPPVSGNAFVVPVLDGSLAEAAEHGVQPGRDAASALHGLLYANGDEDTVPLQPGELAAAQRWLRMVLSDAAVADLSLHESIENWLADTLAGAWPRSAPLLASSAEAFGWEREAGRLGERHTIGFLNKRLKGLRFYDKVQDPAHPLHRAWAELSRPGRSNMITRMRTKRYDVEKLLTGVRKSFPELEEFLDPQRVASWEGSGERKKVTGPSRWLWVIGLIVLSRVIIAIGDMGDDRQGSQPSPVLAESSLTEADSALVGQAIADAFGSFMSLETLGQSQPDLPDTIISNRFLARAEGKSDDDFRRAVVDQVRLRMLHAALGADGGELEKLQLIRLGHLRAARQVGPQVCMDYARTGNLPASVTVSNSLRIQEQSLAFQMLQAKQLVAPRSQPARTASIPGKLIGEVIDETGLPEAAVRDALQKKGSDAALCSVTIALLDGALKWQGTERREILSVL